MVDVEASADVSAALGHALVVALIERHRGWLWDGVGANFAVPAVVPPGPPPPESRANADNNDVDGEPYDVRADKHIRAKAMGRLYGARADYNRIENDPRRAGTHAHFEARLNLRPALAIYWAYRALQEREAWIEEARAAGIFPRPGATAADGLRAVNEYDPAKREEHDDDGKEGADGADGEGEGEGEGDDDEDGEGEGERDDDLDGGNASSSSDDDEDDDGDGTLAGGGDTAASAPRAAPRAARPVARVRPPARPASKRCSGFYQPLFSLSPSFKPKRRFYSLADSDVPDFFRALAAAHGRALNCLSDVFARERRRNENLGASILTDGYSLVSLHEKRYDVRRLAAEVNRGRSAAATLAAQDEAKRAARVRAAADFGSATRLLACDSGLVRNTLFELVYVPGVGMVEHYASLSAKAVFAATARDANRARSLAWCGGLVASGVHGALADVSSRTASAAAFQAYEDVVVAHRGAMLGEKLKRRWARQAMETRRATQQTQGRFWGGRAAGDLHLDTLRVTPAIAWGDVRFAATMRGRPPTATTSVEAAARNALSARGLYGPGVLHRIPEHRTSKCCGHCGCVLQLMWTAAGTSARELALAAKRAAAPPRGDADEAPYGYRKIRGERRCCSPTCSAPERRIVDRDKGAARSIWGAARRLGRGEDPPSFMQRGKHNDGPAPPRYYVGAGVSLGGRRRPRA